jgi:hypothetical protein
MMRWMSTERKERKEWPYFLLSSFFSHLFTSSAPMLFANIQHRSLLRLYSLCPKGKFTFYSHFCSHACSPQLTISCPNHRVQHRFVNPVHLSAFVWVWTAHKSISTCSVHETVLTFLESQKLFQILIEFT